MNTLPINIKISQTQILLLSLILSILSPASTVFLSISPHNRECVNVEVLKEHGFSGKYYMSGEEEKNNKVTVEDSKKNLIWQSHSQKQSEFKIGVHEDQSYTICFFNTDKKFLTVTFDFFEESESNNIVSAQSISDMNQNIHEVRRKVDIIHSDLRNSAIRRTVHMDISNTLVSKITTFTGIKLLFLVMFTVFQVFMITSIFNTGKIINKITINSIDPSEESMKL
mmetsp:Transcript_15467/g.16050  ORF Transcript_15467/g.16050 Transcript_15467/m.16050 type:complete len:225 (+) Transcript_15467:20-694(+)